MRYRMPSNPSIMEAIPRNADITVSFSIINKYRTDLGTHNCSNNTDELLLTNCLSRPHFAD